MMNSSTRLVTSGECVKEIVYDLFGRMSYEEFEQLVTYCPSVKSIDTYTWRRSQSLLEPLPTIDDDKK